MIETTKNFAWAFTRTYTTIKDTCVALWIGRDKCHSLMRSGRILQIRYKKGTNVWTVYVVTWEIMKYIWEKQKI